MRCALDAGVCRRRRRGWHRSDRIQSERRTPVVGGGCNVQGLGALFGQRCTQNSWRCISAGRHLHTLLISLQCHECKTHSQVYHTELGSDEQNAAARTLLSSGASSAASSSSAVGDDKQHARWTAGANLQLRAPAVAASKATKKTSSGIGATEFADEPIVDESLSVQQRMQRAPRCCAVIDIRKRVRKGGLTWHAKGDYLCSVSIENAASAVLIHRLSRHQTQTPFAKSKGLVQCVLFHPEKPFLFVATQQHVRVRFWAC